MIDKVFNSINKSGIVPIFYHNDWAVCENVINICYQNGFRIFEFTNRGEKAAENFQKIKKLLNSQMPDMFLGAGTIFSLSDAELFTSLGANFIVSPILNPQVGNYCSCNKILWIPGCMTTTEIFTANTLGAQIIKLFPSDLLGVQFIKSIRPVFPTLNFLPTGGITTEEKDLRQWFDAGVISVGMGSQLLPKKIIQRKDWQALNTHVKQVVDIVSRMSL